MFTYYKMLTNSVAFFTTAIYNTPNGKILPQKAFFGEIRGFGAESGRCPYEWNAAVSNRDTEPYNSIPVSRLVGGSQAAA